MKDKKNLLLIIVAVVAVSVMIFAVVILIKGMVEEPSNNQETTETTIEDYYRFFIDYVGQKEYAKALNAGYIYLDKCEDEALSFEMCSLIADIYCDFGNYAAARLLLTENTDEEFYNRYCEEKVNLEDYLGVYADKDSEEHFYLGTYPQTGYALEEVPEYVANATFGSNGYAEIYGVEYIKIEDAVYVYEPVRWWKIGEETGAYCFLSECILDVKCFNSTFSPATWDVSTLRTWMNEDFYNNCFNEQEKECLVNYIIPESNNYYFQVISGEASNNDVGVIPAANLSDKTYIFIDHNSDEMRALRKSQGTDYAISQGLKVDSENYGRWWTATSADKNNLYTVVVTETGVILIESGGEVNTKNDVGVRPFIMISKEEINASNKE